MNNLYKFFFPAQDEVDPNLAPEAEENVQEVEKKHADLDQEVRKKEGQEARIESAARRAEVVVVTRESAPEAEIGSDLAVRNESGQGLRTENVPTVQIGAGLLVLKERDLPVGRKKVKRKNEVEEQVTEVQAGEFEIRNLKNSAKFQQMVL